MSDLMTPLVVNPLSEVKPQTYKVRSGWLPLIVAASILAFVTTVCLFCHHPELGTLVHGPFGDGNLSMQQLLGSYVARLRVAERDNWLWSYGGNVTIQHVVDSPQTFKSYIVVVTGPKTPARCQGSEQFLTAELGLPVPLGIINAAALEIEKVTQRRLYPIHLESAVFGGRGSESSNPAGVVAVFDPSTGRVVLDREFIAKYLALPQAQHFLTSLPPILFQQLSKSLMQFKALSSVPVTAKVLGGYAGSLTPLLSMLASAGGVSIALAFAAAPPLWFCLACPIVLGLAAPLVINFGLGGLAGEVCQALKLADDQCFDLWLGALGLGFVLSLASAVPIFIVCRLYDCEHRNDTAIAHHHT